MSASVAVVLHGGPFDGERRMVATDKFELPPQEVLVVEAPPIWKGGPARTGSYQLAVDGVGPSAVPLRDAVGDLVYRWAGFMPDLNIGLGGAGTVEDGLP